VSGLTAVLVVTLPTSTIALPRRPGSSDNGRLLPFEVVPMETLTIAYTLLSTSTIAVSSPSTVNLTRLEYRRMCAVPNMTVSRTVRVHSVFEQLQFQSVPT
jgi:hypothetical protein